MVGLSVIAQDTTQRVVALRALEASRLRLAEAQGIAHLGSFEFEIATGTSTWSDEYYDILGIERSAIPSPELFMSFVHPDDVGRATLVWSDAVDDGTAFDVEFRVVRPDSTERWVRTRAVAEVAPDGTVERVAGTMLDDTERVIAGQGPTVRRDTLRDRVRTVRRRCCDH